MTPRGAWALLVRLDLLRYGADVAALSGLVLALARVGDSAALPLPLPLLVLAWALVLVRGLDRLRRALRYAVGPSGTAVLARLLVLLGLAAMLRPKTAGWVATFALALTLLIEMLLAPVARAAVPLAANLPGIHVRNAPLVAPKYVFVANSGAIGVLGGALAGRVPELALFALTAALILPTLAVLADATLRVLVRHRAQRQLPTVLAAYAPTFLLHFHAPHGSEHQVAMWLPYLDRLDRPYLIVLRNPTTFHDIIEQTQQPVLLCRYASELDALLVPTLKTAFYVNSSPRNEHMLRFLELHHVQLNHGDSDKAASYRRAFRVYDKNFVAGQAAVDRFAQHGVKVPDDAFEIVGRPQVEAVDVRPGPPPAGTPVVLYTPTWNGYHNDSRYSSLPIGRHVVTALLERGCMVVFRPHPWCRREPALARELETINTLLRTDAARTGRAHLFGAAAETERSLVECFNIVDAMVSDVSSVVGDFLYSEKPLAVVDMGDGACGDGFLKEFPIARAAYVVHPRRTPMDLDGVLDDLLVRDSLSSQRRATKEYYLGAFPADRYADTFLDAARCYV